jgi:hypothetical protein
MTDAIEERIHAEKACFSVCYFRARDHEGPAHAQTLDNRTDLYTLALRDWLPQVTVMRGCCASLRRVPEERRSDPGASNRRRMA